MKLFDSKHFVRFSGVMPRLAILFVGTTQYSLSCHRSPSVPKCRKPVWKGLRYTSPSISNLLEIVDDFRAYNPSPVKWKVHFLRDLDASRQLPHLVKFEFILCWAISISAPIHEGRYLATSRLVMLRMDSIPVPV
jgi:hypothetical protein